jgi:hypothetical protein
VADLLTDHREKLAEIVGTEHELAIFAELVVAATSPGDDPNFGAVEEFLQLSKEGLIASEMPARHPLSDKLLVPELDDAETLESDVEPEETPALEV